MIASMARHGSQQKLLTYREDDPADWDWEKLSTGQSDNLNLPVAVLIADILLQIFILVKQHQLTIDVGEVNKYFHLGYPPLLFIGHNVVSVHFITDPILNQLPRQYCDTKEPFLVGR